MSACSSSRQRGAAALFVVVMLCFAMVLVAALAQRNIVVEEQRSANELRSRIAFAADAGLEWALARINDPTPIGATCLPSADPAATSFRARVLRIDAASGAVTPTTWNDAGSALPLQAACIRGSAGWTCSCPTNGRPILPAVDGGALAPAFFVELAASSRPGVVRAVATGCTKAAVASGCAPADAGGREATARVEIAWALLPALRSAPVAALTVTGDLDVGTASLGVANVDAASGGLAVHAGSRVFATALRIDAPPGAPLGGSIASGDDELRALGSDRLFARHFGMPPRVWAAQPAVRHVVCGDDCMAAIAAAVAGGARLLFVDGDAALTGPAVLGSADDPLALVVSGALTIVGDVAMHGVVHAASLDWRDGERGFAFVHGALVVGGDVRGNASADIVRDAAILDRLAYASGSFVRVDGSWKDF